MRRRRNKLPYMPFFTSDYMADEAVMACSLAAQGLWVRMLCVMWNSPERGVLKTGKQPWGIREIATLAGDLAGAQELVNELLKNEVTERRKSDGAFINRRMVREERKREKARKRVSRHRDSAVRSNAVCNADVTGDIPEVRSHINRSKSSSDDDPLTLLPELQRLYPEEQLTAEDVTWMCGIIAARANAPPGSLTFWRKSLVAFLENADGEIAAHRKQQAGAIEAHAGHNPFGRAN